jgi:hypothetical protein
LETKKDLPSSVILAAQSGDKFAGVQIHEHYRNYAKRVASLYFRKGRSDWDDHLGIAYAAIATAIHHFKPEKNDSFIGYLSVILKRSLMSANKKNQAEFDRTVFLESDTELEDLNDGHVYSQAIPALSPIEQLKQSPDQFPARLFALLEDDLTFNDACRVLMVQPKLAKLVMAAHMQRAQVHHELITLFPHEFHVPQRMLFTEEELDLPNPRAIWRPKRRRLNPELKRKQMNLFDLLEAS